MRLLLMCGGEVSRGAEVTEGSWRESADEVQMKCRFLDVNIFHVL